MSFHIEFAFFSQEMFLITNTPFFCFIHHQHSSLTAPCCSSTTRLLPHLQSLCCCIKRVSVDCRGCFLFEKQSFQGRSVERFQPVCGLAFSIFFSLSCFPLQQRGGEWVVGLLLQRKKVLHSHVQKNEIPRKLFKRTLKYSS